MSSMQFIQGLPFCELLTTRPSSHKEGWFQWGYLDDAGEWQSVYGLEKSHETYEAYYLMDAAGVCEAVGQPGGSVAQALPEASIPSLVSAVEVENPSPSVAEPPSTETFPLMGSLGIGTLALVGIAFWLRRKRQLSALPTESSNPWQNSVPTRSIHFQASDEGDSYEG